MKIIRNADCLYTGAVIGEKYLRYLISKVMLFLSVLTAKGMVLLKGGLLQAVGYI